MESKLYVIKVKDEAVEFAKKVILSYDAYNYEPFSRAEMNIIAENLKEYYIKHLVIDNTSFSAHDFNDAIDVAKRVELAKAFPDKFKELIKSFRLANLTEHDSCIIFDNDDKEIFIKLDPSQTYDFEQTEKVNKFLYQNPDFKIKYHFEHDSASIASIFKGITSNFYYELTSRFVLHLYSAKRKKHF